MARIGLKMVGFKELDDLLKPDKFTKRLHKQIRRSNKLIGMVARDAIVEGIDKRQAPPDMRSPSKYPNRPRTAAMKKHDTPLIGDAPGSLRGSLTYRVTDWDRVRVGVLRRTTSRGEDGKPDDVLNVAAIVHEGATVKVTPKMRAFMASIGFPISPETRTIRIPGRPFLNTALTKQLEDQYRAIWAGGVQKALAGDR